MFSGEGPQTRNTNPAVGSSANVPVTIKLEIAKRLLLEVAADESCKWCRGHVTMVADAVADLEELAKLSQDAQKNPAILKGMRTLGDKVEELGLLALLARLTRNKLFRTLMREHNP